MDAERYLRATQPYLPRVGAIAAELERRRASRLVRTARSDLHALQLLDGAGDAEARLFLDVGAHRGTGVAAIAAAVPRARIVAFEPQPALAATLARRRWSPASITVMPLALGETEQSATLHAPVYRDHVFDGFAALDRRSALAQLNPATLAGFDTRHLGCLEIECRVVALDSLQLAPLFIHLDIGRCALAALRGSLDTLRRHMPLIVVDSPSRDVIELLAGLDYKSFAHDVGLCQFRDGLGALHTFFLGPEHRRWFPTA